MDYNTNEAESVSVYSFDITIVKNMKVKIEISICTGLMLNDHSNPYVESTTLLSL